MTTTHTPTTKNREHYQSWLSDNLRWDSLKLRAGDIVICTPPKSGTTWTQRLVSLLVFGGPDLPAPMALLSPWLDLTAAPIEEVVAALDAQPHRRFIKTHTPLDGLELDDRVTYIVVGRDPRDSAVSMLHDGERMHALRAAAGKPPHPPRTLQRPDPLPGPPPPSMRPTGPPPPAPSDLEQLQRWMERPVTAIEGIISLATMLHLFETAWDKKDSDNVAMFHYHDYQEDLVGELQTMATVLDIPLTRDRAEQLAGHATLDAMRARAADLSPDLFQSPEPFFRAGGVREWGDIFGAAEHRRYEQRVAELTTPEVAAWAHRGRRGVEHLHTHIER